MWYTIGSQSMIFRNLNTCWAEAKHTSWRAAVCRCRCVLRVCCRVGSRRELRWGALRCGSVYVNVPPANQWLIACKQRPKGSIVERPGRSQQQESRVGDEHRVGARRPTVEGLGFAGICIQHVLRFAAAADLGLAAAPGSRQGRCSGRPPTCRVQTAGCCAPHAPVVHSPQWLAGWTGIQAVVCCPALLLSLWSHLYSAGSSAHVGDHATCPTSYSTQQLSYTRVFCARILYNMC